MTGEECCQHLQLGEKEITHHKPSVGSNAVGHSLDSAVREEDTENNII